MIVAIGTDLVDTARFAQHLARVPRLAQRAFTAAERATCAHRPDSLAARWAAKEATLKALGAAFNAAHLPYPPVWSYRDIEVASHAGHAPQLHLRGTLAQAAQQAGVRRWHVSLSHDAGTALAFVIAEG